MERQIPMFTWVEEHRGRISFGLQVFARPDDPAPTSSVLAAGQLAEDLGYDAFFIGDHPAYATERGVHLAAVAAATRRVRLGSVVNCVGYRHPVLLARLAADLDHISNGRLILGLGIGWNAAEFAQLGLPFPAVPDRQAALEEAITIIRGVWGPEPFTFHGLHYATVAERVAPAPLQRPGPPLLIAEAGERVTLRQVARFADACNFGPGANSGSARTADAVRRKLAVLRRHCDELGRPYDDILRTHFTTWLMLATDEAAAQAKLDRYYPHGLSADQRLARVVGTPEMAVAYYQALADAGIQYFVVQIPDASDVETIRLLATDVAPHVKPAG